MTGMTITMTVRVMVIMLQGKIVEQGSTEDIFSNPKHDYTKRLLASNIHVLPAP